MTENAIQVAQSQPLTITPVPNIPRSFFQLTGEQFQRIQLMAEMYAMSSFNAGDDKRTKGDYFIIMVKGMELGLSLTAAVEFINVIKGKPVTDGKGMLALIRGSGKCKSITIESQDDFCTVSMERFDGDKHIEKWTMDDARKFMVYERGAMKPLADRAQWKSQPKTMLKWRAVAACARVLFPDVIGGLYTREEMADGDVSVSEDGLMQSATPYTQTLQKPQEEASAGQIQPISEHWSKSQDALEALKDRCYKAGYIEHGGETGMQEMTTLIYPKTWSDFDTRADAATAIKDAAEALKEEIAHKNRTENVVGRKVDEPVFATPSQFDEDEIERLEREAKLAELEPSR